jgi:lysophospholipase L1-like esterase
MANENSVPDFVGAATITNTSALLNAVILGNGAYVYGGNYGVPGETSAQILARVSAVVAAGPDVCVIMAGRNDSAVATTITNITAICDALVAAGITPVLCTLPPDNDLANTTLQTRLRATSAQLRKLATERNYGLADFYRPVIDPANGGYLSGLQKDATHPNRAGLVLIAPALLAALPRSTGNAYRRVDNSVLGTEKIVNGLMSGGSAGIPTGWSAVVTTNGTPSLITNDTKFANSTCWELAIASGVTPAYMLQQVVTLTVGNVYEVSFRLVTTAGLTSPTSSSRIDIELETGAGVVFRGFRLYSAVDGVMTYRFTATHSTLRCNIRAQSGTSGAAFTLRMGEYSVRDLTTLGAV